MTDPGLDFRAAWEQQIEDLWSNVVPPRFVGARLADVPEPLLGDLSHWLGSPEGSLLLFGPTGTGKTHAAAALARAWFTLRGHRVEFWNVSRLLDALRPEGALDTVEPLIVADLLVLDDLGAHKASEWTMERLDLIVNDRWEEMRPTIVTSNFAPKDLAERTGGRVWSRLAHDGVALLVSGVDRRRS